MLLLKRGILRQFSLKSDRCLIPSPSQLTQRYLELLIVFKIETILLIFSEYLFNNKINMLLLISQPIK
jgi:hypothetical protein